MAKITSVKAYTVLDSRGLPTVQCEVEIVENDKKAKGIASVPSGASTGTHEALELRDGESSYGGKGVLKAVNNVNDKIKSAIINQEFSNAEILDQAILALDSSQNKSELGANAILAVSMAAHRAFASLLGIELYQYISDLYFPQNSTKLKSGDFVFPKWMCNIINGGVHADSGLSIQEFMIIPDSNDIEKSAQIAAEVYQSLKKILKSKGMVVAVGDEGGFAPKIPSAEEVLETIKLAISKAGHEGKCDLALDVAASEFYGKAIKEVEGETYEAGKYYFQDKVLDSAGLVAEFENLVQNYGLVSIEDGLNEDDLEGWSLLTQKLGKKIMLVGDDLFVTNVSRLQDIGINQGIANSILIKLNQIGSVSETCAAINLAQNNNISTVISHRSGETTDSFIADLALASQSPYIKTGAVSRGERLSKINRLIEVKNNL